MTTSNQLSRQNEEFSLLETILWEDGDFFLLERHLARLKKSAVHFSFSVDFPALIGKMNDLAHGFSSQTKYRIRVLVGRSGKTTISSSEINALSTTVRVKFSEKRTDKTDPFLAHKTTRRELYNRELELCRKNGYFEILFTNTSDEVSEGAITNIIIKRGDVYLTPPLSSGILPGTYREHLLISGQIPLREQILFKDDILSANEIFIVNSVIKMIPVQL